MKIMLKMIKLHFAVVRKRELLNYRMDTHRFQRANMPIYTSGFSMSLAYGHS
jgi:hypothetical protein